MASTAVQQAECSWDQRQARENLEAELRTTGYPIIPDRELPRDEEGYVAEVTKLLGQSALSIHLVGAAYGAVPDGPTQKSISVLQNELAVGQSKSRGLKRVIWVPDGIEAVQLEQQRFVETLHTSPDAQFGADLIVGDANQEHGIITVRPGSDGILPDLAIGDRVRILPNHACATSAQHRAYHVVHGSSDKVEAEWPRFGGWL